MLGAAFSVFKRSVYRSRLIYSSKRYGQKLSWRL